MSHIDDLKKQLQDSEGAQRLQILNDLCYECWYSNPETGVVFGKEAIALAQSLNIPKAIAKAHYLTSTNLVQNGEPEAAIDHGLKSLWLYEEIDFEEGIGDALNNLGMIYKTIGQHEKALDYMLQAIPYYNKKENQAHLRNTYNNIGTCYQDLKKLDPAKKFLGIALGLSQLIGDERFTARIFNNFGIIQAMEGDLDGAIAYFRQAIEIKESLDDKTGIVSTLHNLGICCLRNNDPEGTRKYYQKALDLSEELHAKDLIWRCKHAFFELHYQMDEHSKALEYLLEATSLKEQVINEKSNQRIVELHKKYESEKRDKEAEIFRLKNIELAEANRKLKQTQEELIELERKGAVLAMAVTANHEINQPLMVCRGNLEMLTDSMEAPDDNQKRYLNRISLGLDKIQAILEAFRRENIRYEEYSEDVQMVIFEEEESK